MKFGVPTDVDFRKRVTSLSTKPEVVWSRRGRHFEIVYDVIYSAANCPIWTKFGTLFRIARKLLRFGQNRKWKKNSNRQIENRSSPYFFKIQFGLRRAAAFVSSPIKLLCLVRQHIYCNLTMQLFLNKCIVSETTQKVPLTETQTTFGKQEVRSMERRCRSYYRK